MRRNSYWYNELERARPNPGYWHTVERTFSKVSARQYAIDIRGGRRINGFYPGELWDARIVELDGDRAGLQIRLCPKANG